MGINLRNGAHTFGRRFLLVGALILGVGCVESAPDGTSNGTANGTTPNGMVEPEDLYDCSDCTFEGFAFGNATINGSLPDRARCATGFPPTNPFIASLGAWARDRDVAAAGTRCVDYDVDWDNDAFLISPGPDERDLQEVGNKPFMQDPTDSLCEEGFVTGIEYKMREDILVTMQAQCGEYRVEVLETDGELSSRVRRVGLAAGEFTPVPDCDDCMTFKEICPEDSIAEGFQTKLVTLDGGGTYFTGFEVICIPVVAQISR